MKWLPDSVDNSEDDAAGPVSSANGAGLPVSE
jgi:hypothetical protein